MFMGAGNKKKNGPVAIIKCVILKNKRLGVRKNGGQIGHIVENSGRNDCEVADVEFSAVPEIAKGHWMGVMVQRKN
jgi:hypothetical protein